MDQTRIRISTLMLLVIIAALAVALVVERRKSAREIAALKAARFSAGTRFDSRFVRPSDVEGEALPDATIPLSDPPDDRRRGDHGHIIEFGHLGHSCDATRQNLSSAGHLA